MLIIIFLALLLSFVSADAQGTADKAAEAFEEGDVEALTTNAGQLFGEVSEALQLAKIAAVGLGIVIIGLIVLRLSQLISKPKADRKKMKKEKAEKEFKTMFTERDQIIEDLKAQLGNENKKNRRQKQ
tara:strand:+ start:8103 stop:8486 length:384 start_codon:yes stop_codon:yes gene_type:complete